MVRLTSLLTGWYRRLGPVVWFGGLAGLFLFLVWLVATGRVAAFWLVVPPVAALGSFFYLGRFTARLVDDIQDAGDALLVHHRGRGWRIPLASISRVTYSCLAGPPRVTIVYRDAMGVADRLEFLPRLSPCMLVFRPPPLLHDLRRRAAAASAGGGA